MTRFYAFDANGNVSDLVGADGTILGHYEYDPYGNIAAQSGDVADENPFRFSTKYFDPETGLNYYGFRHYSPVLGRWLSRDLLTETVGQQNLMQFVGNKPISRVDAFGLLDICGPTQNKTYTPAYYIAQGWAQSPVKMAAGDWTFYCYPLICAKYTGTKKCCHIDSSGVSWFTKTVGPFQDCKEVAVKSATFDYHDIDPEFAYEDRAKLMAKMTAYCQGTWLPSYVLTAPAPKYP